MKLEQQVCSLELAKKFKELGVKQESEFYYVNRILNRTVTNENPIVLLWKDVIEEWEPKSKIIASAFTAAELGGMMPMFEQLKGPGGWVVRYYRSVDFWAEFANTEADARAKLLVYLIENNIYKLPLTQPL